MLALLTKRLACSPPCPYSFVASEALRLHAFKLDRAQVRRWALDNPLAHAGPPKQVRAALRRWQRHRSGELWQLEASPHRWFPHAKLACPKLNLLDDCSRLFTGSKIYERELLRSYFDFLPAAFLAQGRPLQLHVDYHSLCFTHEPAALRAHHHTGEVQRELGQTPHRAWPQARQENRSALRPAPRCPWWDLVWSVRPTFKIGTAGRVPSGTQRLRLEKPPGTKVVLGRPASPFPPKPVLRFTDRPK